MRSLTVVLCVLALVLAACSGSPGPKHPRETRRDDPAAGTRITRTFYVAGNGDDRDQGTRRKPWRTLGFSMARLRAGDRLFVRGGTYRERIKLRPRGGRPDARIVVQAFPGERPVVVGQFWLGDARYWTVDGINVTWATDNPSTVLKAVLAVAEEVLPTPH